MISKTITITLKRNQLFIVGTVIIITTIIFAVFWASAAFIEPDFVPGDSDQDFSENILGANNADNEFNSYLVAANPEGSIIERLESVQDDYASNFYAGIAIPQRYQIYDDKKCSNNNGTSSLACTSGDPEYTGEEGTWASSTDTDISNASTTSGIVMRDLRTGLYWSDAFDEDADGTEDDIQNDFCVLDNTELPCSGSCAGTGGGGCSGDDINNGSCDQSKYSCYDADGSTGFNWSAVDFCLNLELDADGDSTDEDDWRLPTQKELMQAYINGAGNNLPTPDEYYWSSTEHYSSTANAWFVRLLYGFTNGSTKTSASYYARCIRR